MVHTVFSEIRSDLTQVHQDQLRKKLDRKVSLPVSSTGLPTIESEQSDRVIQKQVKVDRDIKSSKRPDNSLVIPMSSIMTNDAESPGLKLKQISSERSPLVFV